MQGALVSFPLPILTALLCAVLAVLAARLDLGRRQSSVLLCVLFALCALLSVLLAVRFGYGVELFSPLQRFLPIFVGPLAYLSFAALAVPADGFDRMLLKHLGAAVLVILPVHLLPMGLALVDWVFSLSYGVYALLLFGLWRGGPDRLVHARLGVARDVHRWILWAMALLLLMVVLEVAIAASFTLRMTGSAITLISIGSLLLIPFLLGAFLVLSQFAKRRVGKSGTSSAADAEAAELEAAASQLLMTTQLFLDPELSAQRLAKRLHVPVRKLSKAINDRTGMNVSQYVNDLRLMHAARLLRGGDQSIAEIMSQSGFLTRSNFYREFQRRYQETPAAYRQSKPGDPDQ